MQIAFKVSLIFMVLVLSAFQIPKTTLKKVDKEIKNTFQIANFTKTPIAIDKALKVAIQPQLNSNNFYKIHSNNQFIGYAYTAKAPSKTDQFDYLVLFNTQLEIIKTKVLVYREDYGNEIGSKRWLKQFIGKTANDTLRYGDTIDAISGATISAKSMTKAMQKMMKGVAILKKNNAL